MKALGSVLVVVMCFVFSACEKDRPPAVASAETESATKVEGATLYPEIGKAVAAGELRIPIVAAMYVLVMPRGDDAATLRARVETAIRARGYQLVTELPDAPGFNATVTLGTPSEAGVPIDGLLYYGRGLSEADEQGLRKAESAAAFMLTGPASEAVRVQRDGAATARALSPGWIVDDATHEVFAPEKFAATRPDDLGLDVLELVSVQAVDDGDSGLVFLETLGMERLGLAELYFGAVPKAFAEPMLIVVNAAAQTLLERGGITRDGVLEIDLASLAEPRWKEIADDATRRGGTGKLALTAKWGKGCGEHEGLIELELPTGKDPEQMRAAVKILAGEWLEAAIGAPQGDPELAAASARARAALAPIAARCVKGFPETEQLRVKAPFEIDGETEFMWVDVQRCSKTTMFGWLINQPNGRSELRPGSKVEVQLVDVFDYSYTRADGTSEGDETTKILQRRQ